MLTRRAVQALLDKLVVKPESLAALVTRLNSSGKSALEAEWELIVLSALSTVGVVDYEPERPAAHAANRLADLSALPGNRLEALKGNRKGQYSIRINDRYRVCFDWRDADAYEVEVTDYH